MREKIALVLTGKKTLAYLLRKKCQISRFFTITIKPKFGFRSDDNLTHTRLINSTITQKYASLQFVTLIIFTESMWNFLVPNFQSIPFSNKPPNKNRKKLRIDFVIVDKFLKSLVSLPRNRANR